MTKEDKELLLKDLCGRLPYGVKVQDELGRVNKLVIGNADLVRLYYNDFSIYRENALSLPFLRPMSSMTDEEKAKFFEEVDKDCDILEYALNTEPDIIFGNRCARSKGSTFNEIDYLNANHFDYRGLIEKGLALVAPEGMYNIKEQ